MPLATNPTRNINSAVNPMTVSQIVTYLSMRVQEDNRLKSRYIKGEVSNFVHHAKTGMFFFTLKDGTSAIRAVMYRSFAEKVHFDVYDGMTVIVNASVEVYERDGSNQLVVREIQPDGLGALYLALEQTKAKLASEGLFDEERKKPLNPFPSVIGVVTAKDGAALQDILSILKRRAPYCAVRVYPSLVQGEGAPASIVRNLNNADNDGCDTIILARGGGSFEDLNCFNSEDVVRCVAGCRTPVISAVGHETDTTLVDYAADKRAPTPSDAAVIVAEEKNNLLKILQKYTDLLYNYTLQRINSLEGELGRKTAVFSLMSPENKIKYAGERINSAEYRLRSVVNAAISARESELEKLSSELKQLDPEAVLSRGYSMVRKDNEIITTVQKLSSGEEITVRLSDGEVKAVIV